MACKLTLDRHQACSMCGASFTSGDELVLLNGQIRHFRCVSPEECVKINKVFQVGTDAINEVRSLIRNTG